MMNINVWNSQAIMAFKMRQYCEETNLLDPTIQLERELFPNVYALTFRQDALTFIQV